MLFLIQLLPILIVLRIKKKGDYVSEPYNYNIILSLNKKKLQFRNWHSKRLGMLQVVNSE